MNTKEFWQHRRNRIFSRTGKWNIGDDVTNHNFKMLEDLVGKKPYMHLMILNSTGMNAKDDLVRWFEAAHICLSWPDTRVWCNQIGALAGTTHTTTTAATVAGTLASDSANYGAHTLIKTAEFIAPHAKNAHQKGQAAYVADKAKLWRRLYKIQALPGFARPLASGDKRVNAMERFNFKKLHYNTGQNLAFAYALEDFLLEEFNESMNIGGYFSAFLLDRGWYSDQIYNAFNMLVNSGVTACYRDAFRDPPFSFMPMQCNDIEYEGEEYRPLPPRKTDPEDR